MRNGYIGELLGFWKSCDWKSTNRRKTGGRVREIPVVEIAFMDEQELIQIIDAAGKKTARRGWNCPSASKIAAYLEHHLEPREKSRLEAHLAHCDSCLSTVGALVRQLRMSEPV